MTWSLRESSCLFPNLQSGYLPWGIPTSLMVPYMYAKDGFSRIHLNVKSSYLTIFTIHCGRYSFLHMLFGLKMSQDIFQMWMDQSTDYLASIIAIHDDIWVFSHTPEEHDQHLLCLMEIATEHGIIFNSAKCPIRQPQIAFYGAVFTAQGMWLDPTKIQALQDLPTPDSQAKLQSFLRLINYLQPFISGLSAKQHSYVNRLPSGTGTLLWMQLSSTSKPGSVRPSSMLLWHTMTGQSLL